MFVKDADGSDFPVDFGSWESVRIYTGREVQSACRLSWGATAPHAPGHGEAGRIDLAEKVAPKLKEFVENPDLSRVPDQDLGDVPAGAAVLVESQEEYSAIISNLLNSSVMEREVMSETAEVNRRNVTNSVFGVHKSWVQNADGPQL